MALAVSVWFAFAITCAYIADKRGKNAAAWFCWGLLGGVFALIVLLATTDKAETKS
jgi:hypothetical protein